MKKSSLLPCLASALTVAALAHADTTWQGGTDNNMSDASNWSAGSPSTSNTGVINSGTPALNAVLNANLTINGGTMYAGTTAIATTQNGATINLMNGTLALGAYDYKLGGTTTLNVTGGNLSSTGGYLWLNSTTTAANFTSVNLNSNTFRMSNRYGTVTLLNSTVTLGEFSISANSGDNNYTATLNLNNSSLKLVSAGGSNGQLTYGGSNNTYYAFINFTGASSLEAELWEQPNEYNFNFDNTASGSTITIASGYFDAATWEQRWTDGYLTVNGSNSGSFGTYFTVDGDTLTFAVPEPGTIGYVALLGLLSLAIRRRKA